MVDGSQIRVPYQPDMEVFALKQEIEDKTKIPIGIQKLILNGKVLENLAKHRRKRLSDFKIGPNSSVYLAKILCELPRAMDKIKFKIDWGYPESKTTFFFNLFTWTTRKKDYLDASCLLYSLGKGRTHELEFTVNHKYPKYKDAIEHSGDVLDEGKKRGEHILTLELQKLPACITHLFFTLSSRITDTLKNYKDPKLEVQDHVEDKPLTKTSLKYRMLLGSSVVVCLYLSEDKIWRVMDIRRSTNGKVSNYHAIEQMIDGIFKDVFCYTYSK
ncbi:hypothetical protein FSP39_003503 [Pinctada imbricata]|uniref:Ubiquitin-like domain-containing protein n=1 Tax=Pinctada imbricata TaxID=66713 RepID=A0AA88XWW3_PINIB|nr:hypothetical protein FSP39_003503 [Pinctada imbricata]